MLIFIHSFKKKQKTHGYWEGGGTLSQTNFWVGFSMENQALRATNHSTEPHRAFRRTHRDAWAEQGHPGKHENADSHIEPLMLWSLGGYEKTSTFLTLAYPDIDLTCLTLLTFLKSN